MRLGHWSHAVVLGLLGALAGFPAAAEQVSASTHAPEFSSVLYGVAYYNEYMPGDQNARLEKDVALMKAAGLNVVRMGESTWSLWESNPTSVLKTLNLLILGMTALQETQ
jgi:beta-galactosidase